MKEIRICPKCKKEFIVKWSEYPANVDDERESYINCPYCGVVTEYITVGKREEFREYKKD